MRQHIPKEGIYIMYKGHLSLGQSLSSVTRCISNGRIPMNRLLSKVPREEERETLRTHNAPFNHRLEMTMSVVIRCSLSMDLHVKQNITVDNSVVRKTQLVLSYLFASHPPPPSSLTHTHIFAFSHTLSFSTLSLSSLL